MRTVFCLFAGMSGSGVDHTVLPSKIAFYLSGPADQKELILAGLNGKGQVARIHFARHNSPNSRAVAELAILFFYAHFKMADCHGSINIRKAI